jgi:general L-amino acid transport system permease protein
VTNRGTYFPMPIFGPGSLLVLITLIPSVAGMIFFGKWAKKRQEDTGQILPVMWINFAILLIPAFLMDAILGSPISLNFPELKGFNFQGGLQLPNSYLALLLGLSIYTSSYIAENVRAGIQAISHGQTEAAYALGLRPGRTMKLVVLPQALRIIIPPLISQWLNLTKNTSLGIFVTYTELKATLGGITMNQTGRELECNFLMMAIYLTISLLISALLNFYNRAVRLKER